MVLAAQRGKIEQFHVGIGQRKLRGWPSNLKHLSLHER
jgi:hypothetical protein